MKLRSRTLCSARANCMYGSLHSTPKFYGSHSVNSNVSHRIAPRKLQVTACQQQQTLEAINKCGIIACLRTSCGDLALDTARNVLDGGIPVELQLEITMGTPKVLEVISKLVDEYPSAIVGVGTVLTVKDANSAKFAGAKFLMGPTTNKDILGVCTNTSVLYIPGAMTPTEVLNAYAYGAKIVKVYPVSLLGGEKYICALKTTLPHIPMIASQGIRMDSVETYIKLGASAVVLSDSIFRKSAMTLKDFITIKNLGRMAIAKAAAALTST